MWFELDKRQLTCIEATLPLRSGSGLLIWLLTRLSLPSLPRPPPALFTESFKQILSPLVPTWLSSPFTPAGGDGCVRLCVWEWTRPCFTAGYSKKIIRRQLSLCVSPGDPVIVWLQCTGRGDRVKPGRFWLVLVCLLDFCFANLFHPYSSLFLCPSLISV